MKIRLALRTWWKSLLLLALAAVIVVGLINITLPSNDFLQIVDGFGILIAGVTGIAGAWGLFDKKAERLLFLTQQVRNQVSNEAKSAISQLSAEGFLHDGSLKRANLRRALLSGAEIESSDANGNHKGANLEQADLWRAKLIGAWMRDINLHRANLEEADLTNAKLINGDLSGANLMLANLSGANLTQANLSGANIAGATFSEKTLLPDGTFWTENKDLSIFGMVEEIPVQFVHRENTTQSTNEAVRLKRLSTVNDGESDTGESENPSNLTDHQNRKHI